MFSTRVTCYEKCYRLRATSSGCRHPRPAPAGAEGLVSGPGVEEPGVAEAPAEAEGAPESEGEEGAEGLASGAAGADELEEVSELEDTGGLEETGVAGASCVQAAMITRLPAGSALPPTLPRSTK